MPSISAAAAHSAHFTDTEAQTTQITSSESQRKKGGYLKRAVFAACALGIAGGLAQAFRTQNTQPYYPANRQLQNKNETATAISEPQAEPSANNTAPIPTPEPTLEPCPKGTYRDDQKTKNRHMRNLKITLAASGGTALAGIMIPSLLCCIPLHRTTGSDRNAIVSCGGLLGILGAPVFFFTSIITIFIASAKPDGLCHRPPPDSGSVAG